VHSDSSAPGSTNETQGVCAGSRHGSVSRELLRRQPPHRRSAGQRSAADGLRARLDDAGARHPRVAVELEAIRVDHAGRAAEQPPEPVMGALVIGVDHGAKDLGRRRRSSVPAGWRFATLPC
jgi:hypothetical protein